MKLIHPDIEQPLVCEDSFINVNIIENKRVFASLISDLVGQLDAEEGSLLLSDYGKSINISKSVDLMWSPYAINFNNTKILNNAYKTLSNSIVQKGDDLKIKESIDLLQCILREVLLGEITNFNLIEPGIVDILKFFKVKFDEENISLLEKLLNYMLSRIEFGGCKLFVLHQFSAYFESDGFEEVAKFANQEEVNILLIERSEHDLERINDAYYIIIDKDL